MVKDILREIKARKLQFLAILLITTLGVGFFIGISVTGHDMRLTADDYMESADVLDLEIINSYGIDEEMKSELNTLLNSESKDIYSSDVYASFKDFDGVISLYELNDSLDNDLTLVEGRLPNADKEVIIDSLLQSIHNIQINDEIVIKENDVFNSTKLKVVGIAKSSLYLNKSRGYTNLGSGSVDGFAYAKNLDKKIDSVTSLRYIFADDVKVSDKIKILEDNKESLLQNRFDRLIAPKVEELKKGEEELKAAKEEYNLEIKNQEAKLSKAEKDLEIAERQLHLGLDKLTFDIPTSGTLDERLDLVDRGFLAVKKLKEKEINDLRERLNTIENEEVKKYLSEQIDNQISELDKMEREFQSGYLQIAAGIDQFNKGKLELENGKQALADAKITAEAEFLKSEKEIAKAYKDIEDADTGDLYIFTREDSIIGYTDFYNDSERIEAIGRIFPLIFFGVAILITQSTLTQMVEESRSQLGVYKALGFTSFRASLKYVGFAFIAWFIGTSLGILFGFFIIPNIIYNAYRIMYETPDLISKVVLSYLWLPLIISFLASVGVAFYKSIRVSSDQAANLLRPALPKSGQRILLEHFPFIWNRFSFLYKVSFRNLFRNKSRFFMTVIGIAGCSGLLITGFGISNSVNSIIDIQFNEIFDYDGIITYTKPDDLDENLYDSFIDLYSDNIKVDNTSVSLYVSDDLANFSNYIKFNTAKANNNDINNYELVITEKLAEVNGLKINDPFNFTYDNKNYTLTVSEIIKNHAGHYAIIDKDIFEETTNKALSNNVRLFKGSELSSDVISEMLENDSILNVTQTKDIEKTLKEQMGNFDVIILVIVFAAFLLELIVLTNLISMNISERSKELATLKVLGFYPKELSSYILRENIILTFIALFVGSIFGIILHKFVVITAEIDMVMFNRELNTFSVIISLILTLALSLIINLIMSKRADKVNMNEALKTFDA